MQNALYFRVHSGKRIDECLDLMEPVMQLALTLTTCNHGLKLYTGIPNPLNKKVNDCNFGSINTVK